MGNDFDFNDDNGDLQTPVDMYSKEPLQIERISNDNTANQLLFNKAAANDGNMRGKMGQKMHADPQIVVRNGALSGNEMLGSSLSYSSNSLMKTTDSRVDWIRRSHLLLELQIDILKYSFGTFNAEIKLQYLFDRMMDLFKITLFYICSYKHSSELFMKIEDLNDLILSDLSPCYLIYTFKIVSLN